MTQTVFTEMSFDDKREQNSSKHIHIHTLSTTYISTEKHKSMRIKLQLVFHMSLMSGHTIFV